MRKAVAAASILLLAAASQTRADKGQETRATNKATTPGGGPCTTDGLIYAKVSPAISRRVTNSITLLEPGARVREVAKLILPCGFRLEARYGWNLVLTNGTEVRRYLENNAFGFAPAFGFGEQAARSYTLNYRPVADGELHLDDCSDRLKHIERAPQLCSSFGSETSFFGAKTDRRGTRIAHFVLHGSAIQEDFPLANVDGRVESIFFLPPPDAPGGTITLILTDKRGTYRAFLDTPKG
jgi:hypothetical protein